MINDLISIIIPAYNVEKYLDDCLKSITSQTYSSIEIIVINDGSTDTTGEIAEEWSRKDDRVLVIHQTNQGVSFARNVGLDKAKGEFIGFVDADDEVESDMYEFLIHNLKKYDADISHCGFELVKPNNSVKFHNTGIILIQTRFEAIEDLLLGSRIEPSTCTKLYKKAVLGDICFKSSVRVNEDLVFNIEVFLNSRKSVFEDVIKYKYNYNIASVSRSSEVFFIAQETYKATQIIKNILADDTIKTATDKFYAAKLLSILKSLKKHDLCSTQLGDTIKLELKKIKTRNFGFRLIVLKFLLLQFPFFFSFFFYLYNFFFSRKNKWA